MKIMLNFLPLKTGGGVQVAMDFVKNVLASGQDHEWLLVCRENMPFKQVIDSKKNIKIVKCVPDGLVYRVYFEVWGCKQLVKKHNPEVIYTQFGPHWFGTQVIQVAGCAYSNLFYPEIDFWGKLPLRKRIIKKLIDRFRLGRILAADVKIFETEDLAKRAVQQHRLDPRTVAYVRSAPSVMVSKLSFHPETAERCKSLPDGYKILLLSGYHPNKNIEFLIDVAHDIERINPSDDIRFILTLPNDSADVKKLLKKIGEKKLGHRVYNFGQVPQEGCAELYRECDATVLPSTLESFSNMIAESWIMEKPLFISDLEWSRSICSEGAIYYEFLNSRSLIDKICFLRSNAEYAQKIINEGIRQLSRYPTSRERFEKYLDLILNSKAIHREIS